MAVRRASEEQPDKLRKTVRFEQDAPRASPDPLVALDYPANGETQDRPGSVLVQKSGHVDDDVQISALDPSYEIDGRKSRYIGEALEWYRGEDVGDLKRSELNELVENLTCLNALEWGIWKSNPKILMDEKSDQQIVMNEELIQNGVMNEKFWKNSVMHADIDPSDGSVNIQKFADGTVCNPATKKWLEEFMDENEDWLLIGISSRDPFCVTQYLERHSVS